MSADLCHRPAVSTADTLPSPGVVPPARGAAGACMRAAALTALRECDPTCKAARVIELAADLQSALLRVDPARVFAAVPDMPGRPAAPALVGPRELARRDVRSVAGRIALLHALAHIEFNAINLALDAVVRFDGLPDAYYRDWLAVAAEEAQHFGLLSARLADHGAHYGDCAAHDGLWDMVFRTRGDPLARMALVPRTLEARGLDASLPIRDRLAQAGDAASAALLDILLRDEIGHVRIGNHWFRWLCERAQRDPHAAYAELAAQYRAPRLKGPFNLAARRAAGFDDAELAALQAGAAIVGRA